MVLEAEKSEIKMPTDSVSSENHPPPGLQTAIFLLCPQVVGKKRDLPVPLLLWMLIPAEGFIPII